MLISSIHRCFLAVVTLLSASNAMSQDISFDYVQATYTFTTVDLGASVDEIEGNGGAEYFIQDQAHGHSLDTP